MKTIQSIGDLVKYLTKRVDSDQRVLWFRGHSNADWDVQPSIMRGYKDDAERNFTQRFRARAGIRYQNFPDFDDQAGWLSLMQHYRLPTRLLDWSRSPLVALYFALEPFIHEASVPQDACIWILEPHEMNKIEGFEDITPSIQSRLCRDMLRPAFDHKGKENDKVMAVMAAETDPRMFVQQGCFTIHSYKGPLNKRQGHKRYLSALRIPAQTVRSMAVAISVCGFRKGDIYPDLEHLALELTGR